MKDLWTCLNTNVQPIGIAHIEKNDSHTLSVFAKKVGKKVPYIARHEYLNFFGFKNEEEAKEMLFSGEEIIPFTVNGKNHQELLLDWYENLVEFEKDRMKKTGHDVAIFLQSVTVMIPRDLKKEHLVTFAKKFIKQLEIQHLPHTVRFIKQGQGMYLVFLFSERLYQPKGMEEFIYANSDFYRHSKTGRRTTKDNEFAVLEHEKGDLIKINFTYFATVKENILRKTVGELTHLREQLLRFCRHFFDKHEANDGKGVYIGRFQGTGLLPYERMTCKCLNEAISTCEDIADQFIYGALQGGYEPKEISHAVHQTVSQYRKMLTDGYFKIPLGPNRKAKIWFATNTPLRNIFAIQDSLIQMFQNRLYRFMRCDNM